MDVLCYGFSSHAWLLSCDYCRLCFVLHLYAYYQPNVFISVKSNCACNSLQKEQKIYGKWRVGQQKVTSSQSHQKVTLDDKRGGNYDLSWEKIILGFLVHKLHNNSNSNAKQSYFFKHIKQVLKKIMIHWKGTDPLPWHFNIPSIFTFMNG